MDWTEAFLGTRNLPRDLRDRLVKQSRIIKTPAGKALFGPQNVPDHLLFLLEGTLRVSQTSENGREIVLYRLEAGQSCVMTTACILAEEAYSAEGIAETDVRAVALPKALFDELMATAPPFRDFVFRAFSHRMVDLIRVIDDVAFGKIDVRLASRLLQLAQNDNTLPITHQQLATELGTAREVISRQLNEFQSRGWVKQSRGQITLLNPAALSALAAIK